MLFRLISVSCALAQVASAQTVPDGRAMQHLRFGGDAQVTTPITRIKSVVVLPNRHVVVLDDKSRSVSMFDSSGRFMKEVAKRGQGPGEMGDAISIGRYRDTLWVYQQSFPNDAISLFSLEGNFLSQRRDVDSRTFDMRPPITLLEQGQSVRNFAVGALTEADPILGVMRYSSSMQAQDTIVAYVASRVLVRRRTTWMRTMANPFADFPLVSAQPGGTHVLVLDRSAAKPALELSRIALLSGRKEFVISHPISPRRLAQTEIDSATKAGAELAYERAGPAATRAGPLSDFLVVYREGTSVPQNAPLARELVAGMDGSAWVRLWGTNSAWLVFDAAGRPAHRVSLPDVATVVAAERDYVWCVINDANDVPWITTFRISR